MRAALAVLALLVLAAPVAEAAQPVFDSQGAANAARQINEMKKQLEVLQEANQFLTDQLSSLGAATTIELVTLDPAELKNQITRGMQCLLPDLESLMPDVRFESVDIGDLCQRADVYRQTIVVDPAGLEAETPQRRETIRAEARLRREAVLEDSVLKGLAAGDSGAEESANLNAAADRLSREADSAENMNQRLAVIAKGQVLQIRATAQNNQLLAQLLKQQSAWYAVSALGVDSVTTGEGGTPEAETPTGEAQDGP